MINLTFGDGRIYTNHGIMDGQKCLILRDTGTDRPVGAWIPGPGEPEPRENFDVILSFKNIDGARLLQDVLGEMLAQWSRENSPVVSE